jgi:hypothetical protein
LWDIVREFTDAGIPAEDVGAMIVSAVRANQFWLLPNAQVFHPIFEQELDDMKAQRSDATSPAPGDGYPSSNHACALLIC